MRFRIALGIVLFASPSLAQEPVSQCVASAERAQVLRREEHLLDARKELEVCAAASCPAAVRDDCTSWLAKVKQEIPSIDVALKGAPQGADVYVDGKKIDPSKSLERDPGEHTVHVDASGFKPQTTTVKLFVSDRHHVVDVTLEKLAPVYAAPPPKPSPLGPAILGGAGVVALGVAGGFFLAAKSQRDDLRVSCNNHCADDVLDPVRTKLGIADIALGAGIVALGASAVWWLTSGAWPFEKKD